MTDIENRRQADDESTPEQLAADLRRSIAYLRWMETHDDCPCAQDDYTPGDCPEHDSTWQADDD